MPYLLEMKNNKKIIVINPLSKGPTSNWSTGATSDSNDEFLMSMETLSHRENFKML